MVRGRRIAHTALGLVMSHVTLSNRAGIYAIKIRNMGLGLSCSSGSLFGCHRIEFGCEAQCVSLLRNIKSKTKHVPLLLTYGLLMTCKILTLMYNT